MFVYRRMALPSASRCKGAAWPPLPFYQGVCFHFGQREAVRQQPVDRRSGDTEGAHQRGHRHTSIMQSPDLTLLVGRQCLRSAYRFTSCAGGFAGGRGAFARPVVLRNYPITMTRRIQISRGMCHFVHAVESL